MTDTKELIARLRVIAGKGMADYFNSGHPNSNAITEAADAIEALEATNSANMATCKGIIQGLQAERDALQAQLAAAQGQCDTITELNHAQWLALENVRMLAARNRKEEWAQHLTRFCNEAGNVNQILRAAPIPQQPSMPEGWKQAVALAYGHLWHVNNEPMAPIPLRSSETAAYEARKQLRDLLTHEERGLAINQVQAMLAAAPQPKETK